MSNRLIVIAILVGGGMGIGYALGQYTGGETALTGGILGVLLALVLK